jgi:SRSO17 transposase
MQQRPDLNAGLLTLDESGDRRSSTESAGVSRQYVGRIGKVDTGQVGVALGYYQSGVWAMVDAELYLPEIWFEKEGAELKKQWHIPTDSGPFV